MKESSGDFDSRLGFLMRAVLARQPRQTESALLRSFYEKNLDRYRESPDEARKLLAIGLAPLPDQIEPTKLAAWTAVCRAVLNLHETITRY